MIRRFRFFIIALIASLVGAVSTVYIQKMVEYGDIVIVDNEDSSPVKNVLLSFQGGQCKLDEIPGRSKRKLIVNVRAETDLDLRFDDASGIARHVPVDAYLEPGWQGELTIRLGRTGSFKVENKLRPF